MLIAKYVLSQKSLAAEKMVFNDSLDISKKCESRTKIGQLKGI